MIFYEVSDQDGREVFTNFTDARKHAVKENIAEILVIEIARADKETIRRLLSGRAYADEMYYVNHKRDKVKK